MDRALRRLGLDLRRGFWGLRAVAGSAYIVGVVGTLMGIVNSFLGLGSEKTAALAAVNWRLAEAQFPQALGLLVALQAWWTLAFLERQAERLEEQACCCLRSFPRP